MSSRHELHAFNYINHPYTAVRRVLIDDPFSVVRQATAPRGTKPALHAKAGAVDISAEIDIEISVVGEVRDGNRPCTKLWLVWQATKRAGLFPTMNATVSIYPLTPTETQLELSGVYDPPMGVLGDVVDAALLHETARATVQRFVDDIATYLRTSTRTLLEEIADYAAS